MRAPSAWLKLWPAWAVPALLVAANVAWLGGVRTAVLGEGTLLEREVRSLEEDIARMEARRGELAGTEEQLASLTTTLEELRTQRLGPMRQRLVPFLTDVVRRAQDAGLAPDSISYSASPEKKSGLVHFTAAYSLKGSYEQIRRCVDSLESSQQFVVIERIALRGTDQPATLEVNVQLVVGTYFSDLDEALMAELKGEPAGSAPADEAAEEPGEPDAGLRASPPGDGDLGSGEGGDGQ